MATAVTPAAATAHTQAVQYEIGDIAAYLQEQLGQRLTGYLAGVEDHKAVGRWVAGEHAPRAEAEARLRAAFQIFQLLLSAESSHTVRAWFIGMNPQLDDLPPAQALREGLLRETMAAARAFVADG